jgi:hypothetical protein
MKCKSCSEVVDPKFKHAISMNTCPFCGEVIVDDGLKKILKRLTAVMTDAVSSNYLEDVEGWLQSNYSLRKIEDHQVVVNKEDLQNVRIPMNNPAGKPPTKFRRAGEGEDEASDNTENNQAPLSAFAQRAGVKPQHKKVIDFIHGASSGAADPSEFVDEGEETDTFVANSGPPLRPNEMDQLSDVFANSGGESGPIPGVDKMQRLKAHSQGGGFTRG